MVKGGAGTIRICSSSSHSPVKLVVIALWVQAQAMLKITLSRLIRSTASLIRYITRHTVSIEVTQRSHRNTSTLSTPGKIKSLKKRLAEAFGTFSRPLHFSIECSKVAHGQQTIFQKRCSTYCKAKIILLFTDAGSTENSDSVESYRA